MKKSLTLDEFTPTYSLEDYQSLINRNLYLTTEALQDYFYKLKDLFRSISNNFTKEYNDFIAIEVTNDKLEVLNRLKRINFFQIKDEITSKPEDLEGKLIDLSSELIKAFNTLKPDIEITFESLEIAIAKFINDYKDKNVLSIYNDIHFKETEEKVTKIKKAFEHFFPRQIGSTKTKFKNIFYNLKDIETLYSDISTLSNLVNHDYIRQLNKRSEEISNLIDVLIREIPNLSETTNKKVKQELYSALYVAAKEQELFFYLYSVTYKLYGSFYNIKEDLKRLSDR